MQGRGTNIIEYVRLLGQMLLIRSSEERLARLYRDGRLPGAVHLYIGQEAVAVGACSALSERDFITSTHRRHGHFLAKGGDLRAMFADQIDLVSLPAAFEQLRHRSLQCKVLVRPNIPLTNGA